MSVRRAKNGFLYFSVRIPSKDGSYIQKKVQNSEWKTKKDAQEAERVFLSSLSINNKRTTYAELWELFITNRELRIKKRTTLTYTDLQKYHILPYFGKTLVSKITKDAIRRWQKALLSAGYSNEYLKNIQVNFKRVLVWGENNDIIEKNPFTIDFIKNPNERKTQIPYFTLDEYQRFRSVITSEVDALVFDCLYWCGLRKGELFALRFCDIDLTSGSMHIDKSFDTRNHIVTTPKNSSSYREILLTSNLKSSLSQYFEQTKLKAGFSRKLFLFGLDKPLSSSTVERKKNHYCELAGLQKIKLHAFRHSHVSLLINSGFNVFDIAKRLGHSSDMVNNTYGHWFKKNHEIMVSKLDQIISDDSDAKAMIDSSRMS